MNLFRQQQLFAKNFHSKKPAVCEDYVLGGKLFLRKQAYVAFQKRG